MSHKRVTLVAALALGLAASVAGAQPQPPTTPPRLAALPADTAAHIKAGMALTGGAVPKSAVGEFFNTARFANYVPGHLLPQPDHPMGARQVAVLVRLTMCRMARPSCR